MKKIITTILILTIGATYFMVSAQPANENRRDSLNSQMKKIAKPESEPNWIKIKEDIKIDPKTIFIEYRSAFNLKEYDKMVLYETVTDDLGFTHHRYQQYYKNIKVDGATYNVHTNKNGITYAANGKILTGIDINVVPSLDDKQAIDLTLKYVNAKEYRWQSDYWEKNLQERTGNSDTTFYPIPQLVIREIKNNNTKSFAQDRQYFLVYRLDIYSSSPLYSQRIFIDANTGEILDSFPLQSNKI